jgi:hypothetical protein
MRVVRRWWWAILLALVVIVRLALPSILRSQIETRASEALHAKVHVGDVDLAILSGGVALNDVSVRALDAAPDDESLIGWKRFAVDLRWLMLFKKTIRFATVELVEPHVALDRLQSGDINLMALVPVSEPKPETETAPAEPSGWKLGIDYVALQRGGLRFRDLLIPNSEPVAMTLQSIEVRDIAFEPEVYGKPSDIRFVMKLDQGSLRTRARFTPLKEGVALDVTVNGTKLPVHRSRVYVPGVAWSDLNGLLSLGLHYRLETGGRNDVSGRIALDDVTVWVGGLDEPGLKWKSLAVELAKIDLAHHDARVASVKLDGAVVPVRPRGPVYLPVLAAARAGQAAAKAAATTAAEAKAKAEAKTEPAPGAEPAPPEMKTEPAAPQPKTEPATPEPKTEPAAPEPKTAPEPKAATVPKGEADAPAAPWTWRVDDVAVTQTQARLLSDKPPLDVGVTLGAKALSGPQHGTSPVKLDLTIGDGTLGIDGTLAIEPLGFAGSISSGALDVPLIVDVVGGIAPGVLQVAKLDTDVKIALGSSAPTPGDVTVSGTTAVSDMWIAAHDPNEFSAGAKRIGLAIESVTVPGALAKERASGRPVQVALGNVGVENLYARVTRTETGIVLPAFTEAPPGGAPPAAATATTSPAPEAKPAGPKRAETPAKPEAVAPPDATQITIAKVDLAGRVDVTDRTVKPFYFTVLDPLQATFDQLKMPPLDVKALKVHAVTAPKKGTIDITGGISKKSDLEVVVKALSLTPFNPYVTGMSPYSISRGQLFITTKAKIDGAKYDTTTYLTLSDFDLASRTGGNIVLEQLGIPLTVAVALLRDWKGNIDLTIPVKMDEKGATVGLSTVITGALVSALVGTLTSPLKLLGAVLPGGGGGESLAPVPIRFAPGLATLDKSGGEQVKQLAELLAGRPALGVMLTAPVTASDVRALREQALLAKLGPRKGVIGTIRNVGARGRIVDALDARSKGDEGTLEPEDAKALDEYLEDVPAPTADQIRQLADARLSAVEKALREQYGIGGGQMARGTLESETPAEGDPGVRVDLGSAHS